MSPMKVKVDLNLLPMNDDKNMINFKKRLTVRSEEFSRSFQHTKLKSNSINKKNFINLCCKSFDNDKNINNFNKSKEFLKLDLKKVTSPSKGALKKNSAFAVSNLNSSIYLVKQNFNSDSQTVESATENKQSNLDMGTKAIMLQSQKNDVDSIEDVHFLFVKFLKQSKNIERLNNIKTCSPQKTFEQENVAISSMFL